MLTIRLLGLTIGGPTELDGQYLVEYDPERQGWTPNGTPMIAHIVTTPNRDEAARYSAAQATELYKRSSGMRPDGRPNRPLTAFDVAFERVDA